MPDPTKSLLDAIKRANRAIPGLQEKAVQTGDFTEVDRAGAALDRLNSLAEEHLQRRQDPPSYMESRSLGASPAVPEIGGGAPDAPPAPPGPPANHEIDRVKTRIADLLKEAQEAEEMASGYPAPRQLPPVDVTSFKFRQPKSIEQLTKERGYPAHPIEAIREAAFPADLVTERQEQQPVDDPGRLNWLETARKRRSQAENLSKKLRALENPPEPEIMPIDPADEPPPNTSPISQTAPQEPAVPQLEFEPSTRPGLSGNIENAMRSAGIQPPKGLEDAAAKATPEQTKQASTLAADAKKTFGDDALSAVRSMEKFEEGVPDWEKEFRKRVEIELGQRPQRTSLERAILAILYGAASIGSRWATGNWRGGAHFPDFDADQKEYDARKAQIGRETYAAAQAGGRQDKSLAASAAKAADKTAIAAAGKKEQFAHAERIANIRANTQIFIARMNNATDQERNQLARTKAEADSLKMQYNALADAFSNGFLDRKAFEAAGNPILDQIDEKMAGVSGGK